MAVTLIDSLDSLLLIEGGIGYGALLDGDEHRWDESGYRQRPHPDSQNLPNSVHRPSPLPDSRTLPDSRQHFPDSRTLPESEAGLAERALATEVPLPGRRYRRARAWLAHQLRFGEQEDINVFETTIRVIGGLLGAYELSVPRAHPQNASGDKLLLRLAYELGVRLLPAFNTPTGLPYGTVGLKSGRAYNPEWAQGASTTSEVGSLQLEFATLSHLTGDDRFVTAADRVTAHFSKMERPSELPPGLYPLFIHPKTGRFTSTTVTLGARADSTYEYFIKGWLQRGRASDVTPLKLFLEDAVACFTPGMLALSGVALGDETQLAFAEELAESCFAMSARTNTGLAPEIADFSPGLPPGLNSPPALSHAAAAAAAKLQNAATAAELKPAAAAIESAAAAAAFELRSSSGVASAERSATSLLVLHRQTKRPRYRDWGWQLFQAFESFARLPQGGYSGVRDVSGIVNLVNTNRASTPEAAAAAATLAAATAAHGTYGSDGTSHKKPPNENPAGGNGGEGDSASSASAATQGGRRTSPINPGPRSGARDTTGLLGTSDKSWTSEKSGLAWEVQISYDGRMESFWLAETLK
ncbi:glycoside hydrolase [Pavlovales sp. CCMP2436]|nr:glycoside hydrolase [Pavlovales sp. CCMP2436]